MPHDDSYLMGRIFAGVAALVVVGGVLCVLERLAPALRGRTRAPGSTRTDILYWVLAPLEDAVVNVATVVAIAPFAILHRPAAAVVSHLPHAIQAVVALVLIDFLGYWWHRLEHTTSLWRLHAIHHSSTKLDWLAAGRNHPVGQLLARVVHVTPLLALGIDPRVLAGIGPVIGIYAVFVHANVRWRFGALRYLITTPLFHRWHHSSAPEARDKNFAGVFPVWDLLFGTFYCPDRQPETFGADLPVPSAYLAQLAYPFRGSMRDR